MQALQGAGSLFVLFFEHSHYALTSVRCFFRCRKVLLSCAFDVLPQVMRKAGDMVEVLEVVQNPGEQRRGTAAWPESAVLAPGDRRVYWFTTWEVVR